MARPRTFRRTPYTKVTRSRGKLVDYARGRTPMVWTPSSSGAISRGRRRMNARIGGYLGIEKKFFDVYASSIAIPAPADCSGGEMNPEGGCTGCLSVPAQGDGEQNRDGKKIMCKSIFVTGLCRQTTVSTDQADALHRPTIFVALVLDTQTNGATLDSEDVFTNPNDTPLVNGLPLRNLQYSSRFRVLAHKTFVMGEYNTMTDGANTSSQICGPRTFMLSWSGDIPMNFTSTTADVANAADNSLHIIAFATSTAPAISMSYNSRMRFVG